MSVEIKTAEQLRAENIAKIADSRLIDNTYMNAFFNEQPELMQFVLRIIMQKEDLVVKSVRTQKTPKNTQGQPLMLDVSIIDEDGTECDIEIKHEHRPARRTEDFERLPETCEIYNLKGSNPAVDGFRH
ncbi:MAG: hypothetical protein NC299_14840 [Lachnospiraceae bacterium]|nr:hypothetical protein [Ruminococcus sp.]MCM1276613.1 hypothetical protein [Lachnospiraceae bacterium]